MTATRKMEVDAIEKKKEKKQKKITPIQIALLVERYLLDNSYATTLSTFRAEAADVFSKTKGKDAPKGLLSLSDILDDYITLKEQKLTFDHDRKKLDLLLHSIHDAIRLYHQPNSHSKTAPLLSSSSSSPGINNNNNTHNIGSGGGSSSPLSPLYYHQKQFQQPPLLPPITSTAAHQHFQMGSITPPTNNAALNNHADFSLPGQVARSLPASTHAAIPHNTANTRKRRKMIQQIPQAPPPAPKKPTRSAASVAPFVGGIKLPCQITAGDTCLQVAEEVTRPIPGDHLSIKEASRPGVGFGVSSSVAKNLFKKLPTEDPQVKLFSSPKTPPPQESPSPSGESTSPADDPQRLRSLSANANLPPSQEEENAMSTCSVISSSSSKKIVVISPFKKSGYYSVKRHVSTTTTTTTTSPLKSPLKSPSRLGGIKRDHVKSRLDFDSEVSEKTTPPSNEERLPEAYDDIFDIEFLDLAGDVSFSDLLDFDIESDMNIVTDPQPSPASSAMRITGDDESTDQDLPLDSKDFPDKDTNIHEKDGSISQEEQVGCEGTP